MTQATEKVNYRITENATYGSREVYFDGKPSEEVRTALKSLRMRWNGAKKCWYGYATENELIAAILGASSDAEPGNGATVYTDGYLGGGAVYGNKSGKYLYGAELSAAIRADLKRAGIKGVSVSCKTYSGGQNVTATIKAPADLIKPRADYIAAYRITPAAAWIYTGDAQPMHCDEYWALPADEQERIRAAAAAYAYDSAMQDAMGVGAEQTKRVFLTVFLFVHGYASMIANNSLKYDEAVIKAHLEQAYRGAILAAREETA